MKPDLMNLKAGADWFLVLGYNGGSLFAGWWTGGHKDVGDGRLGREIKWLKRADFFWCFTPRVFHRVMDTRKDDFAFERFLFLVLLGQDRWHGKIERFFARGARNIELRPCRSEEVVYERLRLRIRKDKNNKVVPFEKIKRLALLVLPKSRPKPTILFKGKRLYWRLAYMMSKFDAEFLDNWRQVNMTKVDVENIGKVFELAFEPLLKDLGVERLAKPQWSYRITEEVLDAASKDPACVEYLKKTRVAVVPFLEENYAAVATYLDETFPVVSAAVKASLVKERSMVHQAVIALGGESGALFVTIADESQNLLKIEEWKFRQLVEKSGRTITLHEFRPRRYDDKEDQVVFNDHKTGRLFARLDLSTGVLRVSCLGAKSDFTEGQAVFYLDTCYVVALWAVLSRLRSDTERFALLKESAESALTFDPFLVEDMKNGGK